VFGIVLSFAVLRRQEHAGPVPDTADPTPRPAH
jgi:hypothetical protein